MGILYPKGYNLYDRDNNWCWYFLMVDVFFNHHTIYIKEKEKKMNNDFFQSSYYLFIGKEMMIDIV